jgi:signal transduction histidine kinase
MLEENHLPEQKKNFETLQYLTDHTLQIVNNVLDVARIDAGKSQLSNTRFSLRLFINKLEAVFENTCRVKKLNFIIETIGNTDVFVKGDEVRLNQVMYNLIGNAIKFTEEGFVKIVVQVHADKDEDEFYHVHFRVIDSGIGIDKSHQQKIFESFTQADAHTTRRFGGSGLGITISDKILNLMQSKLQVESELGKGSCFDFEIRLKNHR